MSEKRLTIALPQICETIYTELKTTPFYKTETGYQFAAYLLSQTETPTTIEEFLGDEEGNGCYGMTEAVQKEVRILLQNVLKDLSHLVISDMDYTQWITSKKAVGGVEEYHQILESFIEGLLLIEMKTDCFMTFDFYREPTEAEKEGTTDEYGRRNAIAETCRVGTFHGVRLSSIDLKKEYERIEENKGHTSADNNTVLNHQNPFADISIKEQQFLFGSDYGQFEALGLATNHTLTMMPKTTEQSCLVLQPGFKIRKTKDLEDSRENLVLFDDTLSTEVAQSDDNIYVYIE